MESDGVPRNPPQRTTRLSDRPIVATLIASLAVILIYTRSLIFFNTPPLIFDIAYLVSVVALSTILVKSSKLRYGEQILLVLLWVLTMRMMIPLRFPEGLISNYPDMIYELQIMQKIAMGGRISFSASTVYAQGYIFTPMLETLLAIVSMILGSSLETTLKYAGPFLGVLTLTFLLGFYRAFLPKNEAILAVFLAGSCFHFLRFDATTVHQSLALVFLSLALYSLTKPGLAWRGLAVFSAFAVVSTHEFTAVVGSIVFLVAALGIMALASSPGMKRGPVGGGVLGMAALMMTMTFSWLALVAMPFFGRSMALVVYLLHTSLGLATSAPISFPLIASGSVLPLWIRIVGDFGIVVFAAACSGGFIAVLTRRENSQYKRLLPYAASGAFVFFIGLLPYLRLRLASDLLSRSFIYVYFLAAPLALFAILKTSSAVCRKVTFQRVVCIFLISLIVLAGPHYNYPRFLYDNTVPMDTEDVRFPLEEWKIAGYFIGNHTGDSTIWGDKIAFSFIGGYGERNVEVLDRTLNLTLAEWVSTYPSAGDVVILRKSMASVPYFNYQTSSEGLHDIIAAHNIVYASEEVVIIAQS
jgi:hypothetical protein